MRMKLSGLPLCKAGGWGLQTPEKIVFVVFFCSYAAKKHHKKGPGAAPQWEICVSFMRMPGSLIPGSDEELKKTARIFARMSGLCALCVFAVR